MYNENECMCCGEEFSSEVRKSVDKELCEYCYEDVVDFMSDDMVTMLDLQ